MSKRSTSSRTRRPTKPSISNAASAIKRAVSPREIPSQLTAQPVASPRKHTAARILSWPFRVLLSQRLRILNLVLIVVALLIVISQGVKLSTENVRYNANTTPLQAIPHHDTALVFGAGVRPDHTPTEYLKRRVETAVDLYKAHRVDAIIMSGDNSSSHYNEPEVMKAYAVKLGTDPSDVIVDYAGFNTYDTCYRAGKIFSARSVTVVTQGYHLPRAVMTCQQLGLDTIGVAAKRLERDWTVSYIMREHVSTAKSVVQMVLKPQPTLLGKIENP